MNVCPLTSLWDSTCWNAAGTLCSRTWQRQYMKFMLSLWNLLRKWYIHSQEEFHLMPSPPIVPVKFAVKLNKVTKVKTDPSSTKTRMLSQQHPISLNPPYSCWKENSINWKIMTLKKKTMNWKLTLKNKKLYQLERKNKPVSQCLTPPERQKHWLEWLNFVIKSPNQVAHIDWTSHPVTQPGQAIRTPNQRVCTVTQPGQATRTPSQSLPQDIKPISSHWILGHSTRSPSQPNHIDLEVT